MKKNIAIITTSQHDFDKYEKSLPTNKDIRLHRISVLKDIYLDNYDKAVLLSESRNVTNRVIKETLIRSIVTEDLSQRFEGYN